MADRQNLYARGFPGVFHRARKTKKSKWILSDGHRAAAHVGHQDEADEEREVGDSVRPERGVGAKITCSIMKEVRAMEYLLAKSDRQLGICLRMLYDEGYKNLVVESVINAKNRMEFHVKVTADQERMAKLNDRYQTLIS